MAKQPSSWRRKGVTAPTTHYPESTVDYDGSGQKYAEGQQPGAVIKQTSIWSKRLKQATRFLINPAAVLNDLLFDTTNIYDAPLTYDGIVVGEPHKTNKKPTDWSKA
jgi:hypothetical protein